MSMEAIITIVLALSTGLLGWKQWQTTSKVQSAEAVEKIGNAYDGLLDRLNKRIIDLENRVTELEKDLKKYTNWNARLIKQLVENGIEPLQMDTEPKMMAAKKPE